MKQLLVTLVLCIGSLNFSNAQTTFEFSSGVFELDHLRLEVEKQLKDIEITMNWKPGTKIE